MSKESKAINAINISTSVKVALATQSEYKAKNHAYYKLTDVSPSQKKWTLIIIIFRRLMSTTGKKLNS